MDYYKILNVSRGASIVEIKKSYRAMALKFHPDRNLTNKNIASEKFNAISTAYQTLSSVDLKENYDELIRNTHVTRRQPAYSARAKNHAASGKQHVRQTARSGAYVGDPTISKEYFNVNMWNVWHYGDDPEKLVTFQRNMDEHNHSTCTTRSAQTNGHGGTDKNNSSNGIRNESTNVNWEHFHQSIRAAHQNASKNAIADDLIAAEEATKQRAAYETMQAKREERRQNDPRFRNTSSGIGGSTGGRDKVNFEKGERGGVGDTKIETSGCTIS
jgi:curved DNA-binding protein CbpA